ncbi:hypothetical protein ACFSHP_19585 [Novosphingobium panipatense]
MSVEDTFDPCRNLAAAARVISLNYSTAARGARVGRKQWGSRFRFIIPGSRAEDLPTAMWRAFTARPRLSRVDLARRHRPRRQRLREGGALSALAPALSPAPAQVVQAAPAWDVFARPAAPALIFGRPKEAEELQEK